MNSDLDNYGNDASYSTLPKIPPSIPQAPQALQFWPDPSRSNKMQTVIVTNNGYDTVLLIDESDKVLSAWTATKDVVLDYLRDGDEAEDWNTDQWPTGFDPELQTDEQLASELRVVATYGAEYGRNGVIDDEARAEFWGVPTQMSFQAIYKAGHPAQFCQAIGVLSTSKRLLSASLAERGIALADVDMVPVEDPEGRN